MKASLKMIIVFSIIIGLCIIGILYYRNSEWINKIEDSLSKVPSSITLIGVIFTIVTLIVTSIGVLYSIKEPEVEIRFKTGHNIYWEEEHRKNPLYLVQDVDGHIDYEISMPGIWNVTLENKGNKTIDQVSVKITLSDIYFINEDYEFNMQDHLHGHGGFVALERTFSNINPNSHVEIPRFPFEIASVFKDFKEEIRNLEKIKMTIEIYINDKESKTEEYDVVVKKDEYINSCHFKDYVNGKNVKIVEIEDKFKDIQGDKFKGDIYGQNPYELNTDVEEYENYKSLYKYYLDKVGCYNDILKKDSNAKALYWGRVYYSSSSKKEYDKTGVGYSISDIEQLIKNDITYGKLGSKPM